MLFFGHVCCCCKTKTSLTLVKTSEHLFTECCLSTDWVPTLAAIPRITILFSRREVSVTNRHILQVSELDRGVIALRHSPHRDGNSVMDWEE